MTAAMLACLALFVLAVRGIDWAPLIVVLSVPIQRSILIGTGDHRLTVTQFLLAAFVAGALLRFASGGISIRFDLIAILFGATTSWIALSVVASPPLHAWAGESYRWVTPTIFF